MRFVFLLFVGLPIAEIFVLIQVGKVIGGLLTVGLVVLTAAVGVALLRQQGVAALQSAREKMQAGALPAEEMVSGLFLAFGGALLLTPGFITDFFGFCCLIPGVRSLLIARIAQHFTVATSQSFSSNPSSSAHFSSSYSSTKHSSINEPRSEGGNQTIEGDYKRED